MTTIEKLKNKLIFHPEQGYALYFYHKGRIFTEVNGILESNSKDKITFDTNFRLASVTKQFIAFGIVRLIKEQKLTFDTNIKSLYDYLPDYFQKITIKHLLNHTSGIYDYEDLPHNEDDEQIQDCDILVFLKETTGTYFEPGTTYRYSNTAYILLGLIIELISLKTLGEFYDEIFQEVNMNTSKVNYQGITRIVNRAYGHLIDENNNLYVKDQYWCSATIGDGGIYSNINDLKKWCLFLTQTKEFKEMKKPNYLGENNYNEYGLGLRIINFNNQEIIYHCGDTIGTNTLLLFSLDLELCLIFLTNMGHIDASIMKDNLLEILKEE